MAQPLDASQNASPHTSGTTLFGIPIGDFGWFATLLVSVAAGFLSFFATTFCAIVIILISNSAAHTNIDFAVSYRDVGFPIGVVVLVVALAAMGTLWVRRMLRKA